MVLIRKSPDALPWLALSALVIVLDQASKHIVLIELEPLVRHPVIKGLLSWTLAFNTGAAFSFLANADGWQRWLFSGLAVVVSAVLLVWLRRTPRADWRNAAPLALIIGGAIGNLIDRVRFGRVTDFIEVYWQDWSFPAFNIADSSICIGAVLLILFGFIGRKAPATGG